MRNSRKFVPMPSSRIYVHHESGEFLTYSGWMHPIQALVCAYERDRELSHNVCDEIGGRTHEIKQIHEKYDIKETDAHYILGEFTVSKDYEFDCGDGPVS
jgi:hypothetical protein